MPLEAGCCHFCWREQQQPILFLLYSCRANTVFLSIRLNAPRLALHVTRSVPTFMFNDLPPPLPSSPLTQPPSPLAHVLVRVSRTRRMHIPVYIFIYIYTRHTHTRSPPFFPPSFTLSPSRSCPPHAFFSYAIPFHGIASVHARYTISPVWRRRRGWH